MNTSRICHDAANRIDPASLRKHAEGLIFRHNGKIRNRFATHPQCLEASQYIYENLSSSIRNGSVKQHETNLKYSDDSFEKEFSFEYILGNINGNKSSSNTFIVAAYYDAENVTSKRWWLDNPCVIEGADNNASGASVMLELAKVFGEVDPDHLPFDIQFWGLVNNNMRFPDKSIEITGLQVFLRHILDYDPEKKYTALMLDIVGYNPIKDRIEIAVSKKNSILFDGLREANSENNLGLELEKIKTGYFAPKRSRMIYEFEKSNIKALLFSESISLNRNKNYPGNNFINTSNDTIDKLNFNMMAKLTKLLALSFSN